MMNPLLPVALVLAGLIGLSLGLIGSGGSIVTLPVLVYVAGVDERTAVPMSLAIVGSTSLLGAVVYIARREFAVGPTAILATTGMAGAWLGSHLTHRVSPVVLMLLFALLMLTVGGRMLLARPRPGAALGRCRPERCAAAGLGIGLLTGFLGVGGGFLVVPALTLLAGVGMRQAVGSSLMIIALNSAAGLAGHLSQLALPAALTAGLLTAAVAGLGIGVWLSGRVSEVGLRRGFAWTVVAVGSVLLVAQLAQVMAAAELSDDYPDGKLGEAVRLGQELVTQTDTHPLTRPLVGNALKCTSCHLDSGRHPRAASFVGVATAYPAWSPREGNVVTLEQRIANCFMRSMNGRPPEAGSEASVAIAAYITWLSRDLPLRMNPQMPLGPRHVRPLAVDPSRADPTSGQLHYAAHCADCHGADGRGTDFGPPVWGPDSFNTGAGLAQVSNLANWLKVAMPLDAADLTEQQALDIAAYVNSHPRPEFAPCAVNAGL